MLCWGLSLCWLPARPADPGWVESSFAPPSRCVLIFGWFFANQKFIKDQTSIKQLPKTQKSDHCAPKAWFGIHCGTSLGSHFYRLFVKTQKNHVLQHVSSGMLISPPRPLALHQNSISKNMSFHFKIRSWTSFFCIVCWWKIMIFGGTFGTRWAQNGTRHWPNGVKQI